MGISYYLNSKYYGLTNVTKNSEELESELSVNQIDYYFVWNNSSIINFSNYEEITHGKIDGLKIYAKIN